MKTGSPWAFVFTAVAAVLIVTGVCQTACAKQCGSVWTQANTDIHDGYGYPETKSAHYWKYTFENRPGLRLKLTAQFPHARYMAYTLYNVDPGDLQGSVIRSDDGEPQHLSDQKIEPKEGGNPYINGVARHEVDGTYEINVLRDDSSRKDDPELKNKLVIFSGINNVSVFLRVYVPDNPDLNDQRAIQGGVDLPVIESFNDSGMEDECPGTMENGDIVNPSAIIKLFRLNSNGIELLPPDEKKIETFRPGPAGLFPNGDAPYLVAPLVPPKSLQEDKLAVLRFKAPTFPDTRAGDNFIDSEDQQVRYWSVCIGGWVSTQSSECIADQEVPIDEEGYVHLLIAPDGFTNDDPNWINLKWTWPDTASLILNPILLFRQISTRPGFKCSFDEVKLAFNAGGVEDTGVSMAQLYKAGKQASGDIVEYAPKGVYCTQDQFETDKCGVDSPAGDSTGGCGN